jgi:hypothetical protein
MNGYKKIRLMDETKKTFIDCWHKVENGVTTDYVDDAGNVITPPENQSHYTLDGYLHFAPNVPADPDPVGTARKRAEAEARAQGEAQAEAARLASITAEAAGQTQQ